MAWSVVIAGLGVLVTWFVATRLARRQPPSNPVLFWVLGLAALAPAWLIAFVGLLGPLPIDRPEPSLEVGFIFSSSAALLGVIVSDAVVRHLRASGGEHRPATYWLLGVGALLPAWLIALLGLVWSRP
ncbi:MAG: hypothetical protein HY726_17090 [Candidatus Rokubacteria bacterium]|nr:hypothetical protein [Candidatus Rokubacteria bacterium]